MLSYQDTVNQDLTERSLAFVDGLENTEELNALIQERFMLYPTNISRNYLLDNLLYNSDNFANCAETGPRSGVFYGPNAKPQMIKNEESIDINRLLYENSDESSVQANQIAGDIDMNLFDDRKGADNNQFIYKNNNNSVNNKNNNNTSENEYTIKQQNFVKHEYQHPSASTSTCPSPTNILGSMDSPNHEFYLMQATDVSPESTTDGVHFFGNAFNYDSMLADDRLLFYTPDNSCDPTIDITDSRNKKPMLTLNLKGTFINEEEINTPNIIDTIMEASEQPLFIKHDDLFDEVPFLPISPQELTPCPSTSSPVPVTDTTDGFLSAVTSPITPPPVRRPGRPRKRRHDSDYETPDEDDDDEYLPPVHQRRKHTRIPKKKIEYEDISDAEDDESSRKPTKNDIENRLRTTSAIEDELLRVNKRGRPPKHTRSISSDDYSLLDPDEARYREMRDRNNEASRKSRYKRKQKEMKVSDELENLEMENVKLKAQVEELQKTVERYRDNLMQVMLSGKK